MEARCAPSLHNRARCRFPASPNDYMVEQQFHRTKKRRHENAIHGDSQGQQGFRGGRPPELETPRRDGEIQRRTDQSWRAARGRRAPCKFEGDAGQVLRREADRDRRAIRRDKGAGCRLLTMEVQVAARGDRLGQTLPQPPTTRRARSRFARCSKPRTSAPRSRLNSARKKSGCAPRSKSTKSRDAVTQEKIMKYICLCAAASSLERFAEEAFRRAYEVAITGVH